MTILKKNFASAQAVIPAQAQVTCGWSPTDRLDWKILIVDDVAVNVKVVKAYLANAGYTNFITETEAINVQAVLEKEKPDLLLLDIMMPEFSGLDILREVRASERFGHMPVLILTSAESADIKREALELGATDFLSKPVDPDELILRVRNTLKLLEYQNDLERKVRERTTELERSRIDIIECLAKAAEYRDNETGRHVIRVSRYATVIARELGFNEEFVFQLEQAAKLHDIGKIAIPDSVLQKADLLTAEEYQLMQMHCGAAKNIFESVSSDERRHFSKHTSAGAALIMNSGSPLLEMASTIALTHHERWDGTGYPLGLSGEDIPIEGRITAVADVYDALSSRRVYKPAFPREKCFAIMEQSRGSHFDPNVLDAFFRRQKEIIEIQIQYADVD